MIDAICFALTIPVSKLRVKSPEELMLKGNLGSDSIATSVQLTFDNTDKLNPRFQEKSYIVSAKLTSYDFDRSLDRHPESLLSLSKRTW